MWLPRRLAVKYGNLLFVVYCINAWAVSLLILSWPVALAGAHLKEIFWQIMFSCNHVVNQLKDYTTLTMRHLILFPVMISHCLDNEIPYAYSWSRKENVLLKIWLYLLQKLNIF